jgi:hypothetical protein
VRYLLAKGTLGKLACILALVGGVLMVLLRIVALLGFGVGAFSFGLPRLFPGYEILGLILGIVAILISRRATETLWAIVLIVIGLVALQGIGALLVLVGGLLGLVSKYV